MENKFKLTNVVLYAKCWYKKTDNIWEDLIKILELDDYTPYDKIDAYNIITQAVQNSQIYRLTELREVLNGIHPKNCWKYGYYVEENADWAHKDTFINKYDMPTAFIYYVLSNLRFIKKTQWNCKIPKVTKYPKGENITINNLYKSFVKIKLKL